jgi:micrococcal nuclease
MKTFMSAEPKTKIIAAALSFLSLCCVSLICFPAFSPLTKPEPTIDVDKAYSQAFQTIQAQYPTQTNTATYTASPQPTNTIIAIAFENPTETALPSATIKPGPASCIKDDTPELGIVLDIVDGDTIKVIINGATYTLRYIGIDTPENTTEKEYYGQEATNRNAELVYTKVVTLYSDVSDKDRYGRLLRYVFVEDQFVNLTLVQEGYASAYRYDPDTACADVFAKAETKPKNNKIGMWKVTPTLEYVAPVVAPPTTQPAARAVCSCAGDQYNCDNFGSHSSAQSCFNYCKSVGVGDVHKLDRDRDGIACESLP